jgi:two-component system, LytTR family, sensor kinase
VSIVNPKDRTIKILQHSIFWISLWLFQALTDASYNFNFSKFLFIQALRLPVQLLIAYFNIYLLLPKFLLKKKYVLYLSLLFVAMIVAGFLQRVVVVYGIIPIYHEYCTGHYFTFYPIFYDTISLYPIVALTLALKLLRNWYKDQKRNEELEKERLNSELKFLKMQMNPHFFFNTLNNLYALTLIKSDDAPEVVLKLSGLMDYLLYESNCPYVTVEKEIEHLKNYLALEKLRYGERLDLKFDARVQSGKKLIAPMLILPFVENTFKHGANDSITSSWIHIDLEIVENHLFLVVENSKGCGYEKDKEKECIGLKNVKRRLSLLYPDHHEIEITETEESFKVELELNLSFKLEENEVLNY